jgi:hypothetical protein
VRGHDRGSLPFQDRGRRPGVHPGARDRSDAQRDQRQDQVLLVGMVVLLALLVLTGWICIDT